MTNDHPKVSVLMITYNHEAFIGQAIDSALMQVTDFDVEIVIGEDSSTDRTREIIQTYSDRYPGRIRILIRGQNIGMRRNLVETFQACRGEYIAMLEGDDFWTDAHKLQKQIEILDSDSEVVICGHNVMINREDGSTGPNQAFPTGFIKPRMYAEDIFSASIPFCSLVIRSEALKKVPLDVPWGHGELLAHVSQHGAVVYLEEKLATYRMHGSGIWNPLPPLEKLKGSINQREFMDDYFDYKYHKTITSVIQNLWFGIAKLFADQAALSGKWNESLNSLKMEMYSGDYVRKPSRALQRRIVGAFWMNLAHAVYLEGYLELARSFMLNAFYHNLTLITNRGAWSIIIRGSLPTYVVRPIKSVVRKLR